MRVRETVYPNGATGEELPTTLSDSTSPTLASGGLLDKANLERFRIECASLPAVNLGLYRMEDSV
jgi:hypothetical protein